MRVRLLSSAPIPRRGMRKSGPYKGRQAEYDEARRLRLEKGWGYRTIAKAVGVNWMTVDDWVKDIPADPVLAHANATERRKMPTADITSKSSRRMRLTKERGLRCQSCGLTEWMGDPIMLEVHHVDGDST